MPEEQVDYNDIDRQGISLRLAMDDSYVGQVIGPRGSNIADARGALGDGKIKIYKEVTGAGDRIVDITASDTAQVPEGVKVLLRGLKSGHYSVKILLDDHDYNNLVDARMEDERTNEDAVIDFAYSDDPKTSCYSPAMGIVIEGDANQCLRSIARIYKKHLELRGDSNHSNVNVNTDINDIRDVPYGNENSYGRGSKRDNRGRDRSRDRGRDRGRDRDRMAPKVDFRRSRSPRGGSRDDISKAMADFRASVGSACTSLYLNNADAGALIGKKGANIMFLRKKSGATIDANNRPDKNGLRQVDITGSIDSVGQALLLIQDVVAGVDIAEQFGKY